MDYLVSGRDRFFDFDHGHVTEAGEIENYRFLENCSKEFAENQRKKSVFNIISPPIMKNFKIGSESDFVVHSCPKFLLRRPLTLQ